MSSISIIIYSYKSKSLRSVIENTMNMSSGKNDITVKVIDQYPLIRSEAFNEIKEVEYKHIFWDHITSPCKHKLNAISKSNTDYILILNDNTLLSKDWDLELIKNINKDILISGTNIKKMKYLNMFKFTYDIEQSNNITKSNIIDRSFIFGQSDVIKKIKYPSYLKYNGEEELLSIMYFCNGIDIYSMPNQFCVSTTDRIISELYTTFSKDHNYNELVEIIKTGKNNFTDLTGSHRPVSEFFKFHNTDQYYIKKIPFPDTDVEYNPHNMEFDSVDSKKFMTKVNFIS